MIEKKSRLRAAYCGAILLGISTIAIVGSRIAHPAPSQADAPASQSIAAPQAEREFIIGQPNARSIVVQNILPTRADILVEFWLPDGQVVGYTMAELPPESFGVYPSPEDFEGQGLVTADAELGGYPGWDLPVFAVNSDLSDLGNDAYLGVSENEAWSCGYSKWTWSLCLPRFVHEPEGWAAEVVVQNLAFDGATIGAYFLDPEGWMVVDSWFSVPGFGSVTVRWPGPEPSFIGSVVIESDQPIIATSVRAIRSGGWRSSYGGGYWGTLGNVLVAPALFRESDLQTSSLCVQNSYSEPNTVTVRYSDGVQSEEEIESWGSHCFDQGSEAHAPGWAGGAVVSADHGIVAMVEITASSAGATVGRWSYAVTAQSALDSDTVALALLLNDYQKWTTTIHLYNPGDFAALVSPRYVSESGFVHCTAPITIPPQGIASLSQSELPRFMGVSMGYLSSTQPVAAVVSATSSKNLGDTDRHFGYEAGYPDALLVPQNPCSTVSEVFLPLVMRQAR